MGASAGSPHKGLVENLVEKAKEILPHQLTGAGPAPVSTNSAAYPYASGGNAAVGALLSRLPCCIVTSFICWSELQNADMYPTLLRCLPCASLHMFPDQSGCQTQCMCLFDYSCCW